MHPLTDKRTWRAQFQNTSEELAKLETLALSQLTDQEALRQLRRLNPAGLPWRERPDWSGLVEFQAILHRRSPHARL